MQLCPKNVHIGPLTGECKRPGALPLPPVALQLPQEPPGASGPPSPARGSAGMPPQPSPVSNSARPNWDGRTTKSASEIKWEESRTSLEPKPLNYKSEILNCADSKEICDLSNSKILAAGPDKSAISVDSQLKEKADGKKEKGSESFSQGLLAISSNEMLHLTSRTQELTEHAAERVEDVKKIKTETMNPTSEVLGSTKKTEHVLRKRNFSRESSEQSPKRKKLIAKLEEILINNVEESKRKRKKMESVENSENKMRKIQKSGTLNQKDENACSDAKLLRKSQKNSNSKAKLLKDRNETVEWKGGVENGIKGPGRKDKKSEENSKTEADKITSRRKSNQERSEIFPEAEIQSVRKSKSCSPSRSKPRECSPLRPSKEEIRRKQDVTKTVKTKTELKSKGLNEHSKSTGKKKNGANGTKGGKQISILNKSLHNKNKKSKSEYSLAVVVLKKFASKKAQTASPRTGIAPKWSNGWSWDSESFNAKVYLTVNIKNLFLERLTFGSSMINAFGFQNDEPPVMRKCYTAMRHVEGDVIHPKDCILLKAGPRRIDLPFVAKVAALWENPEDG